MTGRVDGALNQVAGTVPVIGPPGEAKDGIAPRVVATSVESAGAGAAWLDGGGLVVLLVAVVVGGAVAIVDDAGRGAVASPPDLLQAGISTQMATAVRTATRHRRITSPRPAE